MNECDIFMAVLEKRSLKQRQAFLDEACGGDTELRQRIESLLRSHYDAGSLLEHPAFGDAATIVSCQGEIPTDYSSLGGVHANSHPSQIGCRAASGLEFLTPSIKAGSLGCMGHYEVQEVLGHGGMGIVLRAFDEKLHRLVAIKVMAPQLAASPEARQRFVREAQAAAAVRHDNVVNIHSVEDTGPVPYLVMELIEGISLEERLKKNGLPELVEMLRISLQITEALAAAHRQGLVHRDVKPANILLEHGVQRVKVTDFGLARAVDDASMTQAGMIAGTPAYMSPEQASGESVDCRSDLFSLGSVLYALCTGQAPFRANNTLGVLKKVCEESPRPIRELNPYVPDFLANLIENLLAKDPDERYQSAAEVADLLSQFLAFAQQAGMEAPVIIVKSRRKRRRTAKSGWLVSPQSRRWLLIGTAAVFLMGLALGLTEAQGVTQLTATVIRILTPTGTLVIETDGDPAVKVTIEGDGGLLITGAGPQEVRLRPGKYWLRANRYGTPIQPDRELVTISRGDKQVVRVRMESNAPLAAKAAAKPGTEPFVVMGRGNERSFDTLASAVTNAQDGDTIEIRGNGPFVGQPITITRPLNIRAGAGFWPVIQLSPEAAQARAHLLEAQRPLTLEGLELQLVGQVFGDREIARPIVDAKAPLHMANCRLLYQQRRGQAIHGAICELRNCEIIGPTSYAINSNSQLRMLLNVDNCCLITGSAAGVKLGTVDYTKENTVRLAHTTFVTSEQPFRFAIDTDKVPGLWTKDQQVRPVQLQTEGNIWDARSSVILFAQEAGAKMLPPGEAETSLPQLLTWHGERNLYAVDGPFLGLAMVNPWRRPAPINVITKVAEWGKYWGAAEAESIEGRVRYQGGDLLARLDTAPDKLTADDFRLSADSAGYRASPGGKDLGADVDLVGPGAAYERWKKTPEYQVWLKDTGQLRERTAPKPQSGPFVIQGGPGVPERGFDTLVKAVVNAHDDDTIEIRGNGPFDIREISNEQPLIIRAAEGFRPVLRLQPEDQSYPFISSAPLVLEGLEIQCLLQQGRPPPKAMINSTNAPIAIASCRLIGDGPVAMMHFWGSPTITLQNCELLNANRDMMSWTYNSQGRLTIDNSILAARDGRCIYARNTGIGEELSIHVSRTTGLLGWGTLGLTVDSTGPEKTESGDAPRSPLSIELVANVLDVRGPALALFARGKLMEAIKDLAPDQRNTKLTEVLTWREQSNLYGDGKNFVAWSLMEPAGQRPIEGIPRSDFAALFKVDQTHSQASQPRFQGGNLRGRLAADPLGLTPDDFRLRADSPGYRAGPDAKDLGADLDLVGPGPAYERWKKTAEYQEWLKETRK